MRNLRVPRRAFGTSSRLLEAAVPATKPDVDSAVEGTRPKQVGQAPNRGDIWSRSQKPRSTAMTGPRFEQTDFELQVGAGGISRSMGLGNADGVTAPTSVGHGNDTQAARAVDA